MARPKKPVETESPIEAVEAKQKDAEAESAVENKQIGMTPEEMMEMIAKLTSQIETLTKEKDHANSHVEERYVVSKMDTPCTIIHMVDCTPNLPTTITVNGREVPFSKFGEKRSFRFADVQDIVAHYRSWFERGVFILGEDCKPFEDELGISIRAMPISMSVYDKLAELPVDDFRQIVNTMPHNYAVSLAKTWINRYNSHVPGYDNFEYARILNKKTDGFMRSFISNLAGE